MFNNLSNLELASLIGLGATLMVIISNLIANKKMGLISVVIYVAVLSSYVLKYFSSTNFNKIFGSIDKIDLYMQIASGAALVISLICLCIKTNSRRRYVNLIKYGSVKTGALVGYISKNHKLIHYNKTIEDILKKEKDPSLAIKELYINGNVSEDKNLLKIFGKNNLVQDEVVRYQLIYLNNVEVEYDFIKTAVLKKKKLLGYILIDKTVTNTLRETTADEMKKSMYVYLDLLNMPIAYFDRTSSSYICSASLVRLLGIDSVVIKYDDFKKKIHKDDLGIFENKVIDKNSPSSVIYRLNTKHGLIYFEEVITLYNEEEYIVIKKVEVNNISGLKYFTHRDMINEINTRQDFDYGILMINFKDVQRYVIEKSREFVDALVSKFFTKINESYLKDQFTIYKLGAYEFALIVNYKEKVDMIIRDFSKNISELLYQEVTINNQKFKMATDIGVVYAKDFINKDKRSLIKAAFDIITEVTNPNYTLNYSIYEVVEEKQFSLEDLGINLDEDLKDYE